MAPVEDNINLIDLDFYSSPIRRQLLETAFETKQIVMSPRLECLKAPEDVSLWNVILVHPGQPHRVDPFNSTSTETEETRPEDRSAAALVISMSRLIMNAIRRIRQPLTVHIFDVTDENSHECLGGAYVTGHDEFGGVHTDFINQEVSPQQAIAAGARVFEDVIFVANRQWHVIVTANEGAYQPELTFVIMGGLFMLLACIFVALWFNSSLKRQAKLDQLEARADQEKAQLM